MTSRILPLPSHPQDSFFLWGPRQVGKSSILAARALRLRLQRTWECVRSRARREPRRIAAALSRGSSGAHGARVRRRLSHLGNRGRSLGTKSAGIRFVPAFTARPKRRVIQAPKFYFADVGVVNHLAQRGMMAPGSELFGKAMESLICHQLSAFRESEISSAHLRGLIAFGEDHPNVRRRIMVCLEPRSRVTSDGIEIIPVAKFLETLWRGEIASASLA